MNDVFPSEAARWIWLDGADADADCYVLFRRAFDLADRPAPAPIRLTAGQSYRLWVNGRFAGYGPVPSDPAWQHYDELDLAPLLAPGRNVLAVLAHNHGLSNHDLPATRGGFLCELTIGETRIASDPSWKAKRSARHAANAPRRFWSAGFSEVADLALDEGWERPGHDDSTWAPAADLGPCRTWPWGELLPRPIPRFGGDEKAPVSGMIGRCDPSGAQVVAFDAVLGPERTGIVRAACWVRLPPGEARLRVDCDDAFVVFLDGKPILAQQMDPAWVRTRLWFGRDRWDQVHDGVNGRFGPPVAALTNDGGWRRLVVAVDHGTRGWGFALCALPADGAPRLLPLECRLRPEETAPAGWDILEPLPSNGFADALDRVVPDPGTPCATCNGLDGGGVTDMAVILQHEARTAFSPADVSSPLPLRAGQVAILDLGRIEIGFPTLEFAAHADGAVVDIGWSNLLPADCSLRYCMGNYVKYADRLRLRSGVQRWTPALRRSFRYAHISCRSGSVTLRRLALRCWYCPTAPAAEFECGDVLLNRIHAESVHAARLLMQESWQDCLRREMGTVNTQSFNYASLGALLALGATDITGHTLRTIIRTQERSGWFDSHGLSGLNQDESTQCLHYHQWVRDWWRHTGDEALVREIYPRLAENLEFFLKRCRRDGLLDQSRRHESKTGDIVYLIDEVNRFRGYACPDYAWGPQHEGPVPTLLLGMNALAAAAADCDAELAPVAGFARHAPRLAAVAERIRTVADRVFWDETMGRYAASLLPDGTLVDHHPLIDLYALRFGMAPPAKRERLTALLARELGPERARREDWPCSLLGSYHHLLDAMFERGRAREAVDLLRILFGAWLEHGGTAMPEGGKPADLASGRLSDDTEVHAYGLGALAIFHNRILGVQPAEPGYARVRIAPCPGGLAWARGSTHTPHGLVRVEWRIEGETFYCEAHGPTGIALDIVPPPGSRAASAGRARSGRSQDKRT